MYKYIHIDRYAYTWYICIKTLWIAHDIYVQICMYEDYVDEWLYKALLSEYIRIFWVITQGFFEWVYEAFWWLYRAMLSEYIIVLNASRTLMFIYTYIYIYIYIYTCTHMYIYICNVFVFVHVCVCVYVERDMYINDLETLLITIMG